MGDYSLQFVFFTFVIYAVAALFSVIAPPAYQIFNPVGIIVSAGGMLAVTGACVITTGIPCAATLALYGVGTLFLNSFLTAGSINAYIQDLIFLPLSGVFIYIVLKLARGTG